MEWNLTWPKSPKTPQIDGMEFHLTKTQKALKLMEWNFTWLNPTQQPSNWCHGIWPGLNPQNPQIDGMEFDLAKTPGQIPCHQLEGFLGFYQVDIPVHHLEGLFEFSQVKFNSNIFEGIGF